jgi:hypothetical protein
MQINPKMLRLLLSMNDDQLAGVIRALAAEAGINPAELSLDAARLNSIRSALGSVREEDLSSLSSLYEEFRRGKTGDTNG